MGVPSPPVASSLAGIAPHALTAAVTLGVAWFGLVGVSSDNLDERLRVAFDRIDTLEQQVTTMRVELLECMSRNLQLEQKVSSVIDTKAVLQSYLDSLPHPAWIKRVEIENGKPVMKMWMLNRAYEREYGVGRLQYVDKTDFEIWPEATAQEFYENDLLIYSRRQSMSYTETFTNDRGAEITRTAFKFALALPNDVLGIGGMIVEDTHTDPTALGRLIPLGQITNERPIE